MYYKLDGKKVVPTDDPTEAFKNDIRVAKDTIGDVEISTVFSKIDHGYGSTPVLFETMIFGGELDQEQKRYTSWEEAEKGHRVMVEKVQALLPTTLRLTRRQ